MRLAAQLKELCWPDGLGGRAHDPRVGLVARHNLQPAACAHVPKGHALRRVHRDLEQTLMQRRVRATRALDPILARLECEEAPVGDARDDAQP